MEYNLISNIEQCINLIRDTVPVGFIYYSHIPTAIIALFFGIFVFIKDKRSLVSKTLLGISVTFGFWLAIDLITWVMNYNGTLTMFVWSLFGILDISLFIFSLWFVYVFIYKEDLAFYKKMILGALLLPVIIATSTILNLVEYDVTNCNSVESNYIDYITIVQVIILFWIIATLIRGYKKADASFKSQIVLLGIGIVSFLVLFLGASYLADYLVTAGIVSNYTVEPYGLFGMTIFLGFLAYLIVKFKAFNIKLIGAQALVFALVALVGSQFFFAQNLTSNILTGITLILIGGIGIALIRSVKMEVERKEQLQLMSDKLAEANDKLRKLDNAKSEFISIASHQLRTPLTAIKGFISLLTEGTYGHVPKNQVEVLNKVYISNERLITLVEDLLNISRIESGRMEFRFGSCNLVDLCKELVDTFIFKAKDAGLYLDFKVPENALPEVFVDSSKVREVLSNLIDNAIKYTPKGGVSIRLERVFAQNSKIEKVTEKGAIRITIADTGIGIPMEEIPYLFSKFSRGKDVSRLNVGGTGLGLYVGKSMIEANGGKVWVESDGANLGSRFIMEVPVEQTPENLTRWS